MNPAPKSVTVVPPAVEALSGFTFEIAGGRRLSGAGAGRMLGGATLRGGELAGATLGGGASAGSNGVALRALEGSTAASDAGAEAAAGSVGVAEAGARVSAALGGAAGPGRVAPGRRMLRGSPSSSNDERSASDDGASGVAPGGAGAVGSSELMPRR
jgi:hypothetical protein